MLNLGLVLALVIAFAIILRELLAIRSGLSRIEAALNPVSVAGKIEFYALINGVKTKVEHMFLKVSQSLPLSIEIKDKFGNPAKIDGAPQWAVTDAALGVIEPAADGMSAKFIPAGAVGILQVQVKADADLGEGVKELLGSLDLELVAGEAVSVAIAAGSPEDIA